MSNNMTDNPPWGLSSIIIMQPGTENLYSVDWDNTNSKWTDSNSSYELIITRDAGNNEYTATINYNNGGVVATAYQTSGLKINSGTPITSNGVEFRDAGDPLDLWTITDNSGAAGDPHITPFFGKPYTI